MDQVAIEQPIDSNLGRSSYKRKIVSALITNDFVMPNTNDTMMLENKLYKFKRNSIDSENAFELLSEQENLGIKEDFNDKNKENERDNDPKDSISQQNESIEHKNETIEEINVIKLDNMDEFANNNELENKNISSSSNIDQIDNFVIKKGENDQILVEDDSGNRETSLFINTDSNNKMDTSNIKHKKDSGDNYLNSLIKNVVKNNIESSCLNENREETKNSDSLDIGSYFENIKNKSIISDKEEDRRVGDKFEKCNYTFDLDSFMDTFQEFKTHEPKIFSFVSFTVSTIVDTISPNFKKKFANNKKFLETLKKTLTNIVYNASKEFLSSIFNSSSYSLAKKVVLAAVEIVALYNLYTKFEVEDDENLFKVKEQHLNKKLENEPFDNYSRQISKNEEDAEETFLKINHRYTPKKRRNI